VFKKRRQGQNLAQGDKKFGFAVAVALEEQNRSKSKGVLTRQCSAN
jgi:hypothetical protein